MIITRTTAAGALAATLAAALLLTPSPVDADADSSAVRQAWSAAPAPDVQLVKTDGGVVPMAVIPNGRPPSLPKDAEQRRVSYRGQSIFAIEIAGSGPPIVLAHGFPDSLHLYDQLYPRLKGRRVIAFDFVGWGRSSKPKPVQEYDYTTAAQTGELAAVMDAYRLDDVTLVLHDQSAPVGLDYALGNQERLGEIVLLNGFYGPSRNLKPPKGIEVHDDPRLQDVELAVQAEPAAIEALHRFQLLPDATLTLVQDAGHYVQIDAPKVVAKAILARP
jgi:pimeloyl-ACP methyl ester carboxylesterase